MNLDRRLKIIYNSLEVLALIILKKRYIGHTNDRHAK